MASAPKPSNGNDGSSSKGRPPPGVVGQIATQVKASLLATVVTGIVTALVATLLTVWALIQQWPGKIGLTPSGAVMAFDLGEGCPTGWSPYLEAGGRFVIGAVVADSITKIPGGFIRDSRGVDLSPKPFGKPGGAEVSQLSSKELPAHTHNFAGTGVSKGGNGGIGRVLAVGDGSSFGEFVPEGKISQAGEGQLFTNMPPYVALYYCKKG